jgi:hypothetical protein
VEKKSHTVIYDIGAIGLVSTVALVDETFNSAVLLQPGTTSGHGPQGEETRHCGH